MPRLNLVLMIALSAAVAVSATVFVLRAPRPDLEAPRIERLIRLLADHDQDVRRDAARELRELGVRAQPALEAAARDGDPQLAARAKELLGRLRATPKAASSPEPVAQEPSTPAGGIDLALSVPEVPDGADEPFHAYLRLRNWTDAPLLIARQKSAVGPVYSSYGFFEIVDAEGVAHPLKPADIEGAENEVVVVAPGGVLELAGPNSAPWTGLKKGSWIVRFVYDASEGSAYRSALAKDHPQGRALPSGRLVSNAVPISVQ